MCVCETIRPHGQLTLSWQSNMSQNHFNLFPHKVFRSWGYLLFAVNAMFENSRNLLCSCISNTELKLFSFNSLTSKYWAKACCNCRHSPTAAILAIPRKRQVFIVARFARFPRFSAVHGGLEFVVCRRHAVCQFKMACFTVSLFRVCFLQ